MSGSVQNSVSVGSAYFSVEYIYIFKYGECLASWSDLSTVYGTLDKMFYVKNIYRAIYAQTWTYTQVHKHFH